MNKGIISFDIEKFFVFDEENIDVSFLPMLVRRKLSKLDKIVFFLLNKLYASDISNFIFASKKGEFERLQEIIKQYQDNNMVSPIKFSSSVHNFSIASFCQQNNITDSYMAISAGEETLSMALVTAISKPDTKTCICCADKFGIGLVVSTKNQKYNFEKGYFESDIDEYEGLKRILYNEKNCWNTKIGKVQKIVS